MRSSIKQHLALLTAFFLLGLQAPFTYAHEIDLDNVEIIHMTEDGYEPEEITITVGTEVIFENIGQEEHWPAGDDHPSHTLYDGTTLDEHCGSEDTISFDSCFGIAPGESYSFTFDKAGIVGYHDHLWPHLTGSIIVIREEIASSEVHNEPLDEQEDAPEEEPSQNIFSRFFDLIARTFEKVVNFFSGSTSTDDLKSGNTETSFYEDLKSKYQNIVIESDPRVAIETLQAESQENEDVLALCHDVLHEIGHAAFDKYGSFQEAAQYQSDFCNSGFVHGTFESYFKTTDDALKNLPEQCAAYASYGGREFDLWQCYHGVGHGLMYLTGGDLEESIDLCDTNLTDSSAKSCENGAYMEVFNLEILAKEESFVNDDPFTTCKQYANEKGECYAYIPTYYSQRLNMPYKDIFQICKDNAEPGYENSCIQAVGSEAIKRNMDNPKDVFSLCEQAGNEEEQVACSLGLVGTYINQKGSFEASEDICNNASRDLRETCEETRTRLEPIFQKK